MAKKNRPKRFNRFRSVRVARRKRKANEMVNGTTRSYRARPKVKLSLEERMKDILPKTPEKKTVTKK